MRFVFLASLLVALLISPLPALADGFFIPKLAPGGYAPDITEPDQKAVILHYQGKERLILQVSFQGTASEFAWLVPTPSRPKLSPSDARLFELLHEATGSRLRYWFDADRARMHGASGKFVGEGHAIKPTVEVLERREVGGYDVAVLRATVAKDLVDWLVKNGYLVTESIAPVVGDYIKKGWVFTAARINTAKRVAILGQPIAGTLQPLQFEFASKEPVYPLKISSLNPGSTNVLLYVIADHFVVGPPLRTICAVDNRTTDWTYQVRNLRGWSEDALALEDPESAGPSGRYCVTKLSADLLSGQMTDDLTLSPAVSQAAVPPPYVSPPFLDNLGALVAAGIFIGCVEVFMVRPGGVAIPILLAVSFMVSGRARRRLRIAGIALLVWVFLAGTLFRLEYDAYRPLGLVTIIAVLLLVALLVRRTVLRLRKATE